jgi:hypothetical protein
VPVDIYVINIISRIYSTIQTSDTSIQQSTEFWHDDFENELSVHNQADAILDLSKVQLSEPDGVDQYINIGDDDDTLNDDEQEMLPHFHLSDLFISAGPSSTKRPHACICISKLDSKITLLNSANIT